MPAGRDNAPSRSCSVGSLQYPAADAAQLARQSLCLSGSVDVLSLRLAVVPPTGHRIHVYPRSEARSPLQRYL